MKLKMLGLAALSVTALMAIGVGTASATTLELEGVQQNASVNISATLAAGSTMVLSMTSGFSVNTCTESSVAGHTTSPFTGTKVTGPISSLSFTSCHQEKVEVDTKGKLYIEWAENTTGTVFSEEAVITVPTTTNPYTPLKCITEPGRKIGTLHGKKGGSASIVINAVINCGFILPTAKWAGEYTVTSPNGLGVVQ